MASEILDAIGAGTGENKSKAKEFYEKYIDILYDAGTRTFGKDYVMKKDDLEFLNNNFEFYGLAQRAKLFAAPPSGAGDIGEALFGIQTTSLVLGQTAELDAGIVAYFNKSGSNDETDRLVLIKYGGAWIEYMRLNKGDATLYSNKTRQNIENEIQKIYFEYETQGSIFSEVRSSYVDFSYVKFKEALSQAINEWFKTDPLIEKLEYAKTGGHWEDQHDIYWSDDRKIGKDGPYGPNRIKALKDNKFFEKETKFETYAPGRTNDIQLSDDLSKVTSAKGTEAGYFTDERQNALARIYFHIIGKELLKQNYKILSTGITEQASLIPIRKEYNFAVDASVNEKNGPSPRAFIKNGKGLVGYRIAQDILNNLRFKAAEAILKLDYEDVSDPSAVADVMGAAEEAVRNDEEITGTDTDPGELSEEDIEAKQKFLKQCLLMSRLNFLAQLNITQIESKTNTIHKVKPYKGRLYLIDEKNMNKDKSSIINKLLIPNKEAIGPFLDIKPSEHANLIPKIRLVKVYSSGSALVEHEFKFPKHSNSNRVNNLSSVDFDRGADFGVKEFSFSFDGTSPATAKNDITANLKLYFQSFQDFVEKKAANDGHRYVDLLILPGGDKGTKKGSSTASPLQFDPSYYRIRADVGWEAESAPNAKIKKAIQKINKTFYLNMVDHEIDIRDDGSVEINVSYRAYIETALKGTTLDALASRESREALSKIREEYKTILDKKSCTLEELTLIRGQFLQIEENLRKKAFQSIINRLIDSNLIRNLQVSGESAKKFEKTGYIASPAIFVGDKEPGDGETVAEKSNPADFILKQNSFKDVKLKNSSDNRLINYFYLADLLYVILDCLYDLTSSKNINEDYITGTENFKFLLSSFQYVSVFDQSQVESVNLGNIPISVELFNEWFTENVIKPERTSYPVMYFIRDLTKFLITEILLESCFKNDLDKKLQFKTTSFLGKRAGEDCPISNLLTPGSAVLDVGDAYTKGDLPLSADVEGTATPVKDLFNYITIFAETTRGKTDKKGIKTDDEKNGIMHYQIGRDRGILKKIKFSKTDMQYIREARFFRHGNDGLMQMSAVYKISMDMVGNTIYYPGMEVFIDPRGLLGAGTEFDPTTKNSIANKLGFGGYHLVTSVKSSIGPGKFTTTVDALFSYNGDSDPKSKIIGSKDEIAIPAIDKDFINQSPQTPTEKTYCEAISDRLYQQLAATGYNFQPGYPGLGDRVEAARQAVVRDNTSAAVETIAAVIARDGGDTAAVVNQLLAPGPSETSTPYIDTEAFTNRKFYDEDGFRYYENGDKVSI